MVDPKDVKNQRSIVALIKKLTRKQFKSDCTENWPFSCNSFSEGHIIAYFCMYVLKLLRVYSLKPLLSQYRITKTN